MCTTVVESWGQCSDNGDLLVCAILKLQSITRVDPGVWNTGYIPPPLLLASLQIYFLRTCSKLSTMFYAYNLALPQG